MYAQSSDNSISILTDCLEFIEKLNYKTLEKKLSDNLKSFEKEADKVSKSSDKADKSIEQYCIYVKKVHASILRILKDIIQYTHSTNAALINHLEESYFARVRHYNLWCKVNDIEADNKGIKGHYDNYKSANNKLKQIQAKEQK